MTRTAAALLSVLIFAAMASCGSDSGRAEDQSGAKAPARSKVILKTSKGTIKLELDGEKAPITVENFLAYVDANHYDGTTFHRVIPNFMIQGGGFSLDMSEKPTRAPIENEADNGLKNDRGTLVMARTQAVNSATAQFFINVKDNDFLNHSGRDFGYAVFGRVVEGMDVVDEIAKVPSGQRGPHGNVPLEPVVIESARRD